MTPKDILDKIEYEYDLDVINPLSFNYYTHLNTREYNCLINAYKKYLLEECNGDKNILIKNQEMKKIHDFMYFNSYIIYRAIYVRRYRGIFYGLMLKDGSHENDVLQEFTWIFYKVLDKYNDIGEASSYSSYVNYWYRYILTELIRTKYFQVLKVPQKLSRERENRIYKNELFEDSNITYSLEDDIIEHMDSRVNDLLEQVRIMIKRKYFTKEEWIMFLKYNRMYGDCKKYTLDDICKEYNIETINKAHYKISKVINSCKKNYLFKKRNEEVCK